MLAFGACDNATSALVWSLAGDTHARIVIVLELVASGIFSPLLPTAVSSTGVTLTDPFKLSVVKAFCVAPPLLPQPGDKANKAARMIERLIGSRRVFMQSLLGESGQSLPDMNT